MLFGQTHKGSSTLSSELLPYTIGHRKITRPDQIQEVNKTVSLLQWQKVQSHMEKSVHTEKTEELGLSGLSSTQNNLQVDPEDKLKITSCSHISLIPD